ncbi:MAG: hypothetical protein ACJ06V_06155 [Verrucomicrobiota bacterium]
MTFKIKPITESINRQSEYTLSDLVHGVSQTDLEEVTLRIVDCNMERGKYLRGLRQQPEDGEFQHTGSRCSALLKEGDAHLEKPTSGKLFPGFNVILADVQGPLSASEVSESHGLFTYWEF